MALARSRMLICEFLSKDTDIIPEEDPLIILNSKSAMCMANNVKDAKHTRHIVMIMNFLSNGEKCKMNKIDWCEVGLQLEDIANKNVVDNDLNPRMKYITLILYN